MGATIQEMIDAVRAQFDPVMTRLGARDPTVDRKSTSFHLAYFGDVLGLALDVEVVQFFIFPMIFRARTLNERPIGYHNAAGRVQLLHLRDALEKLRVCYPELSQIQKLGGSFDNCTPLAATLARVVEQNWEIMVRRVDDLLPLT